MLVTLLWMILAIYTNRCFASEETAIMYEIAHYSVLGSAWYHISIDNEYLDTFDRTAIASDLYKSIQNKKKYDVSTFDLFIEDKIILNDNTPLIDINGFTGPSIE